MTAKKWLVCFVGTALLLAVLLGAFNMLTDPFGVFGDPLMNWYSYNETNNPRAAKTVYLENHFDAYDSYILGCSSTSSFPVEALNEAYDASFYNMIVYGADMLDTEQSVRWLLDNDDVKHILLNVYIDNGLSYDYESNPYTDSMHAAVDGSAKIPFYARFAFANPQYGIAKLQARKNDTWLQQTFDVFDEATGCYDKKKRDIESIGEIDRYLSAYPVFTNYPKATLTLPHTTQCMESIARIRTMCEEAGCELIVAAAPVYCDYLAHFSREDVENFYTALAETTDFWDFSFSSVSFEPRYFYDGTHFRNAVGDMAVSRICGGDRYIPDDFGVHVSAQNVKDHFAHYWEAKAIPEEELTAQLPILMYHHLSESEQNSATITPQLFASQMEALSNAGFTTVTFDDLKTFVNEGRTLPAKPVLITFDDGYESNYEYAYPILQRLNMKATIFAIGSSIGKDTYKETGIAIHPHFDAAQAEEMVGSGLISIQSHTWDMHQSASLEEAPARESVCPFDGEREEDFIHAMQEDFSRSIHETGMITKQTVDVLAYPEGIYSELTQAIAWQCGFRITVTSDPGTNTLVRGLPQTLLGLRRYAVTSDVNPEQLLEMLQ